MFSQGFVSICDEIYMLFQLHVADVEDDSTGRYDSVVDRTELDDFLITAMMREQKFFTEKQNIVILGAETVEIEKNQIEMKRLRENIYEYEAVQLPRRPIWDEHTSPSDLERWELDAFQNWRRNVSM